MKHNLQIPLILLALAVTEIFGPARALAGIKVTLQKAAAVSGSYIRLADVAAIEDDAENGLAEVMLGKAPMAGRIATLSRWQVKAQLLAWGLEESSLTLNGASQIKISRLNNATVPIVMPLSSEPELSFESDNQQALKGKDALVKVPEISEKQLLEGVAREVVKSYIIRAIGLPQARISVDSLHFLKRFSELSKVATLKVESGPKDYKSGNARFTFGLFNNNRKRFGEVDCSTRVRISLPVVVARTEIPRKAMILREALSVKYVDNVDISEVFMQTKQLIGQKARVELKAGAVVKRSAVEVPALVVRGQILSVNAQAGAFQIKSFAQAQQSGKAGQVIRVKNLESGSLYSALIARDGSLSLLLK